MRVSRSGPLPPWGEAGGSGRAVEFVQRSVFTTTAPLSGSREGKDGVRSRACGGQFRVRSEELRADMFLVSGLSQTLPLRSSLTPHRISFRAKRSASATLPPFSVGTDPQGGSDCKQEEVMGRFQGDHFILGEAVEAGELHALRSPRRIRRGDGNLPKRESAHWIISRIHMKNTINIDKYMKRYMAETIKYFNIYSD